MSNWLELVLQLCIGATTSKLSGLTQQQCTIISHNFMGWPGGCPAFWGVSWVAEMAGRAETASLALLAIDASCSGELSCDCQLVGLALH